ncbi:hypothetical protein GCM10022251_15630 [Phytohabitans flavus]|uniref:Uncharacterized protein n=1 Tax=Phytohabitans flavus TaxID=1076124 RepID=A0A6F8Y6F6_9ACTN|nr:hypothetical protein [Phytohabitans flavus]BCB81696.1 hypothetical protein Pflav_081060 [Phytohabitans flavus]
MRGGLDDALERLARMDQLRRRAEGASGGLPTAHGLAEAIEAVRRVVERHPDLNITLYGEQGEGSAEVRIGWEDGVVRAKIVSVEGPEAGTFAPSDGPIPVLPAEIPPMTDLPRPLTEASRPRVDVYPVGHRAEPPPVPEVPRLVDPARLVDQGRVAEPGRRGDPGRSGGERRHRHAAPEAGFLPDPGGLAPASPADSAEPSAWTERAGGLPQRQPRAWKAEHEDNPGAAARLAAMIREDPSLLANPDDR